MQETKSSDKGQIIGTLGGRSPLHETDLGHQANLKESSESKKLAELRLQVLAVVITNDACESKKENMRLRELSTK